MKFLTHYRNPQQKPFINAPAFSATDAEAGLQIQSGVVAGAPTPQHLQECLQECRLDFDCLKDCLNPPLPDLEIPEIPRYPR